VERCLADGAERSRVPVAAAVDAEREQVLEFLFSTFEETVHLDDELTRSYHSLDLLYRLAEGLNRCTTELEVVVEALNPHDAPGYLTPSPEAALRLAQGVGAGVLLDAYHVARIGRDPATETARVAGAIGHVHVADCPGRGGPGTGDLDLWSFLDAVDATGYAGPVGLEYDARGDTPASLSFLADARDPAPFP